MNAGNEYKCKSSGGFGDCNDESLICDVPTPLPVSSATSILDIHQTTEKRSFCDDSSQWNRADYESNINILSNMNDKQKQYLKLQAEKYARNKALIAHLKNLLEKEAEDYWRKKTEITHLSKERRKYEQQVKQNTALCAKTKERFSVEETINRDLKKMKTRLLVEQALQKQATDHSNADDPNAPKRLTDRDQNQMKRLQQKGHSVNGPGNIQDQSVQLNEASLPYIKTGNGKYINEAVAAEENLSKRVAVVLPNIDKGKVNLTCQKKDQCQSQTKSNATSNLEQNAGLQNGHKPQPPLKDTKNVRRYHRKYKAGGH